MLQYDNLVLEGGGILGIALCGAISELEQLQILKNINNFAGTSVGAIIAGALACRASAKYLSDKISSGNFASFLDYGNKIRAIVNITHMYGLCTGDVFEHWYSEIIGELTGNSNITLMEIYCKYGTRLVITATSLGTQNVVYFDHNSHPDLPLVKLVRMSMSIPFIFEPVTYINDVWVDGGVLDNYPIHVFHNETPADDKINPKTLGIRLFSKLSEVHPKIDGFIPFLEAIVGCYMSQPRLEPQDSTHTITIDCGIVKSLDFGLPDNEKKILFESGKLAVKSYFAR